MIPVGPTSCAAGPLRALIAPALHASLPLALGHCVARTDADGWRSWIGRRINRHYAAGTVGVAALGLVLSGLPKASGGRPALGAAAAVVVVAAPMCRTLRSGHSGRLSLDTTTRLGIVAAAEEIIWRSSASRLAAGGRAAVFVAVVQAAGFGCMHIPLYGRAKVPYLALLGLGLDAAHRGGGAPLAILAHWLHNLALATAVTSRGGRVAAVRPASSGWT